MVMACDFLPCSVTVTRFYARFGALAHEDCRNNAIWCTKKRRKKQDMAHGKTHTKKNTIWRTNKRRKKYSAREKHTHKKKKTIWCTKKRRNKHDIVREKKKTRFGARRNKRNMAWVRAKMCFFWWKNVAIYWSFSLEKSKKNTIWSTMWSTMDLDIFLCPWRKQRKNAALRQEKRTSWNCHVWCVTTRNCYSWAGWTGFVAQNFPTCSQTA